MCRSATAAASATAHVGFLARGVGTAGAPHGVPVLRQSSTQMAAIGGLACVREVNLLGPSSRCRVPDAFTVLRM